MKARTNISVKDRRRLTLSEFRGVDFSKSPLHVSGSRATESINFIGENGRNKKRNGWVQLAKHLPMQDGKRPPINGIFPYKNGDKEEALIHAGKQFYRAYQGDKADPEYECEEVKLPAGVSIASTRSQAFASNGFLFIIGCGTYIKYNLETHTLHEIAPYIPITTIDINPNGVTEGVRKSHDLVNLLTGWRKNLLGGGAVPEDDDFCRWKVDAEGFPIDSVVVTITESGEIKQTYYSDKDGFLSAKQGSDGEKDQYGYIDPGLGYLCLPFDTTPKIEGENNITVEFYVPAENQSTVEQAVAKSKFGVLFGVGGNADRLFVAGNPNTPNVVYFSEMDNFEYFPDQYTATFGTSGQAITAMLRLSDNTLAVFKEYSEREPSVYYQSGEYRTTYDADGNLERITPVFSITAGATLESAINPWTCGSFAGDNLILSKNGVFAIELTENVSTDVRTARERSLAINTRLKAQTELKEAVGVSYKGKYYLAVNGCCFVADSLYKYTTSESQYTQYEWWYWENIPARVFAVVNDELWFGDASGALYKFGVGYSDSKFVETEVGDLGLKYESNGFTINNVSSALDEVLTNDKLINVLTDHLYAVYLSEENMIRDTDDEQDSEEKKIFVYPDFMNDIYEGAIVYVDYIANYAEADEYAKPGVPYTVANVDRANYTFELRDNGVPVKLSMVSTFRLLWKVSGANMYIKRENNILRLKKTMGSEVEPVTLVNYDEYACTNPIAMVRTLSPVQAYWLTPPFDMGTNVNSKTLLKLTVSTDHDSYGRLRFGFETKANAHEFSTIKSKPFSFEDLDFSNFSFETGFWSSYTVKVKEPNFNYIRFWFLSDSDSNCSINDLTAIYKINARNLGVR